MFGALAVGALLVGCSGPVDSPAPGDLTYQSDEELRHYDIGIEAPRELKKTGKIYLKGDYILVNEMHQGVHVINYKDPSNPKNLAFVKIPGNVDVAVKENILYADNYMDLVAFNYNTGEITREKNAFKSFRTAEGDFVAFNNTGDPFGVNRVGFNAVANGSPGGASMNGPGTGGSMTRFAIVGDYMYVVDGDEMKVFDIKRLYDPQLISTVAIGFEVETIFPHEDKLFIGGTQGMYVFDNSNPENPEMLSRFEHAVACDPVVVDGNTAYVTLRGGNPCGNSNNELLVVDVNNVTAPALVKAYPMHNPHGLAVEAGLLYLCDGNQGLKVYDTSNPDDVAGNLIFKDRSLTGTFDVIADPGSSTLIVVGKDGLHLYDRTNAADLKPLSTIAVNRTS